jgi:hypothetical protein
MVTLEQVQQAKRDFHEASKYLHEIGRDNWDSEEYEKRKAKFYELYNKWHKLYNRREYEIRKARQLAKKASV